ncbi:hypothetical protein [Aquibium sp. ELW1220]|uniref:hypothetical protein n=1 Tax=Aquibium sp. ELW1220 TaxID=2976766 RepID=UPI0025AF929C|nr:hypothetical protein [Aquibium sp. ELW1220]MDN2583399.1 hypothetical protein [Aquibium sp. ELW1220]
MAIPWAPIIGAGASILGKIFGGGSQKQTSTVDYVQLVKNAEKAGFNPLTALRNGGAAGFTTTSTPALSPMGIAGEVLGGVGNFLQNFDPLADQKREAEYRLVEAQIANLDASTSALTRPGSFNVPARTAGNVERRPSGTPGQLSAPNPARFGGPLTPEIKTPEATNPWHRSTGALIDPNAPNASVWEDRYGELIGSVAGTFANVYADGKRNFEEYALPALADWPTPYEWWTGTGKRDRLRPN